VIECWIKGMNHEGARCHGGIIRVPGILCGKRVVTALFRVRLRGCIELRRASFVPEPQLRRSDQR